MDIKGRFYANLEMIREDYDHVHKGLADQLQGYADKDKKNRNKNPTNQRWYKKWSSAAKSSRKKAVTGMDEEAEQLDETQDSLAGGLRRTDRPDLDLSKEPLNKKGKLSRNTKKWMKAFASPSRSLYSRKISKPKGKLPEE